MTSANQLLRDEQIWQTIKGQKDAEKIYQALLKITGRLRTAALAQVAEALSKLSPETVNPARLARALKPLAQVSNALFDEVYQGVSEALVTLSKSEAESNYRALLTAIPTEAQAGVSIIAVAAEQISAAALSRPMQGALISQWIDGLASSSGYRSLLPQVENAVRAGVLGQKSYAEVTQSINNVVNGVELNVRSIVTTAVNHIQAEAREQTYSANEDLFSGREWVSTLDNHTTPICQYRDSTVWKQDGAKWVCVTPGKTKALWLNGPGRAHWGCRSVSVPVVKSWKELGLNRDELSEGTRASMDGQIPEKETFGDWIARQIGKAKGEGQAADIAYARLEDLYGLERARRLVAGELKFPELFTTDGTKLKSLK